jgi:hypothetical protein
MARIKKIILGALSLKEEISHAKLSTKVIYPEGPDVPSPYHVLSLISYGSVHYVIATLNARFIIWI